MTMQMYSTSASRNLIRAAVGMLAHAEPMTVLGDFGQTKPHPKNSTDTIVFRRTLPFGASTAGTTIEGSSRYVGTPVINVADFVLGEGATPNANGLNFQDVTVTLSQYGLLYKFSSKVADLYEDDIPGEMVKQCGETMAELLEKIRYGVVKAGSTVIYGNGSSRAAVNTVISLNSLRKAARTLQSNRAKFVTQMVKPGVDIGTRAVQPAFLVFVHTDVVADCRNLTGFTRVEDYGSFKPIHPREFGACEDFRFISSPVFEPFLASGSGTLNSCLSVGGANVDVYPCIVVGEDCWGQVALKGQAAMSPTLIPASQKSHANPLGQFGFVGASTWFACVRLNDAWMARLEVGVSAL